MREREREQHLSSFNNNNNWRGVGWEVERGRYTAPMSMKMIVYVKFEPGITDRFFFFFKM
jgi:hypothetical protein